MNGTVFGNIYYHWCLFRDWEVFWFPFYTTVDSLNQNIRHIHVSNRLQIGTTVLLKSKSSIWTSKDPKVLSLNYQLDVTGIVSSSHLSSDWFSLQCAVLHYHVRLWYWSHEWSKEFNDSTYIRPLNLSIGIR